MKTTHIVLIALLAISPALAQKAPKAQSDAERYIRESESAWAESVATGETATLARILADDFVGVDPKGKVYSKTDMIRDTKDAPKYFRSNKLDSVTIRFFGDTAVAHGSETWERQNGQRGQFVWIDTWIRRKGVWQIVAAEDLIVLAPTVEKPKP